MNRKTAKDYKNQYTDLNNGLTKLSNEVTKRLLNLSEKYPEAPIHMLPGLEKTYVFAKSLVNQESYINDMPLHTRIFYIEKIETYTKSLENVQQLTLNF